MQGVPRNYYAAPRNTITLVEGRYIVKDIPAYLCGINPPTFRLFQHV